MKDGLLQTLIDIASTTQIDDPLEQGVTLAVGGFLVSGYIISRDKYMQHDPIFKAIWEREEEQRHQAALKEAAPVAEPPIDDGPNFIHLRDAKYFATVGNPIPGNMPLYCRFTLDAVHGFSIGVLSPLGEELPGQRH